MKQWLHVREVFKNIGTKSLIATVFVFLLTVAATFVGGIRLYNSTKDSIVLQGKVNAQQSAMSFDRYLLVRKNSVLLATNVINKMLAEDQPVSEILHYLTTESRSIKDTIDKDYTGLYGWIKGQYCDGDGWVPDKDYIPTERPWYLETMTDNNDITFVSPYLDAQTKSIMMTLATRLRDGKSVLALDISLKQIQEITESIARQTPGSYCFVLNRDGRVIAHSDTGELGKNYLKETGTLGASVVNALYKQKQHQFELKYGGQEYMVYAENLEGGWHCASLVNTAEFYRPLEIILALLTILTLLEAVVFIAAFYHLSSKNLAISIQNVELGTLGDMYLSMQDIDLNTDSIRSIQKGADDDAKHSADSYKAGAQNALKAVYENGLDETTKEVMESFVDLSTLPERLANIDTVAVEYLNAEKIWCRARFLAAERDAKGTVNRVLWLVESIDEEKKHRDKLKSLSETDPMTGVRSKHAYLMKEKELNDFIDAGNAEEFAVVVCDVNGLKKINDTLGHKAGDEYIREACRMICEIFQHSPVYRVGGDEFTVILTGRDYTIRKDLMILLHDRSVDHITAGGAVVSGGLSDFRAGEDESTHAVFQRADERMYEEKKNLKSLGAVTRDDSEAETQKAEIPAEADAPQSIIKIKRHLLIVEDEAINREMLGLALGSGYELVFAADGYEALEQIRAHKDELALILLDLLMPRMSGMEVLKTLHNDEELNRIPVIVMTADHEAEVECLKYGAMDFIPKPYPKWEFVRARISKCIELSEGRDIIRATERDNLTSLFNIDYFLRYVKMFDQHYGDIPMDAMVLDVNRFHIINEHCGREFGDTVLKRIGVRIRTLARELGGVGTRQKADTFLIYCPHQQQKDYAKLLDELSANLIEDESCTEPIKLRMGVYPDVDKELDIERRFENAKFAADAVKGDEQKSVGVFNNNMG